MTWASSYLFQLLLWLEAPASSHSYDGLGPLGPPGYKQFIGQMVSGLLSSTYFCPPVLFLGQDHPWHSMAGP